MVFLEYWKRTESAVAMRWGMTEYEANEESRPEFNSHPKTVPLPSPVTGISQKVFPKAQKARRIMFSSAIVFLFMVALYTLAHLLSHLLTHPLTRHIVPSCWSCRIHLHSAIPVTYSRKGLRLISCIHSELSTNFAFQLFVSVCC